VLKSEVDSIYVVKHLREMYVYRGGKLLKIYKVSLGDAPVGHKHFQGDEKTPEGLYYINDRNPLSICHKNLGISYPNDADRAYARKHGQPTGGDIKIHGLPNGQGYIGKGHLLDDWTNGCIGVTDEEVDELYGYVRMGSPILIVP
jgi:murein L,D-transpeptidase YafK